MPIGLLDHEMFPGRMEEALARIENTLLWGSENLRSPHVICLEGGAFRKYEPDHPINLRYMRLFTTMSLTHSNGYVLFTDGYLGHKHYWYDFWDADLGMPIGGLAETYEVREGLYIREYTNGWAVYNHSGEAQVVTLPEEVRAVASGLANTEHAVQNLDGDIYLRVTVRNPADINQDGVVNIFDLTLVSPSTSASGADSDSTSDSTSGAAAVNASLHSPLPDFRARAS